MALRRLSNLIGLLAACGLSLAAPPSAHADAFAEFLGARAMAMGGAHRGLGTSNETLILNPAGMAMTKRYNVDALYGYGGADHINHGTLSAVDSKSSPVAAGVSYTRDWGNPSGSDAAFNRVYFGMAYALSPLLAFGANVQNLRGGYNADGARRDLSVYNGTVGLSANLGHALGLGVAYQNMLGGQAPQLMPPNVAFGASLRSERLTVAYDMRFVVKGAPTHRMSLGVGAEAFLRNALALRAGFRRSGTDPVQDGPMGNYITGGLAGITPSGGLQISYEQRLNGPGWGLVGGLQLFM